MQSIEMCINYNYLLFGSLTKNDGGPCPDTLFRQVTNHVDLPARGKGGGGNSITLIE